MKTLSTKLVTLLCAIILFLQSAFALVEIKSAENQTFDQHQGIQQSREITIIDDSENPKIKASSDIRIKIPEDFQGIWDDRINEVGVSGIAADNGRFDGVKASVSYEEKDKIAKIDVKEDFQAGEIVKINGLFFEGFYKRSNSFYMELIINGEVVATDSKYLAVRDTDDDDNIKPETPSNISLSQTSENKVKIIWEDPSDMDVSTIQILRGVSPLLVSGTPYREVACGSEEFIDDDVEVGDTISYILRANDGRNFSANSEEFTITLVENVEEDEEEAVICTTDYTPVCGSDNATYSNACNAEAVGITSYTDGECESDSTQNEEETPPESDSLSGEEEKANQAGITLTALQNAVSKYSDLEASHWSSGFLARLNSDGILNGYPDGSIQPDTTINRAELAKIATKSFGLEEDSSESNYTDISTSDWFNPFVNALQNVNAVWISEGEYLPASGVSRGEATWILLLASGIDLGEAITKPFPDVSASHPYAKAIAKAKELNIVNGYENGYFGINDTLTRAQVAKIVVLIKQHLEASE